MSRAFLGGFLVVLAAAAFLRLHDLRSLALNNDEIAEVRWSSGSLRETLHEVRRDNVHPPLDYLIHYLIARFDVPEWVHRLPSVLAGTAVVAFLMMLGKWWHSPAAGLFAGVFAAVSPVHVRYSQEVRPYALGVFFVVAALVALECFAATRKRRWWAIWFASVFLAGATLYLAGLVAVIASLARLFLVPDERLQLARRWFPLAAAAWTVFYAPWLGVVLAAARGPQPSPPERLVWAWWQHRLHAFGAGGEAFEPLSAGTIAFWALAVIGVGAALRRPPLRTAAGWLLLGGAATILVLQLRPHYANVPRYYFPAATAAIVCAGAGAATLWKWWVTRAAVPVLLLAYIGSAAVTVGDYYDHGRPDWRAAAVYVHERAKPGEAVLLANNWVVRNFGFYWQRLPERPGVRAERFFVQHGEREGPLWIVTGWCRPTSALDGTVLMRRDPLTEYSEIRYLPPGRRLLMARELCPE